MVDWNLRLVLNRVWGDRPVAYRSWAVDPEPTPLERAFWRRFEVDVLAVEPDEYVGLARAAARGAPMSVSSRVAVGLAPFEDSELDALYFFGRERDTEIVVANLIASRLTVLYGPSGVGKSSLLFARSRGRCGSCPRRRSWWSSRAGEESRPRTWRPRSPSGGGESKAEAAGRECSSGRRPRVTST